MRKIFLLIAILLQIVSGICGELKTLILQPGPQNGFDAFINSAIPDEPGYDKGFLVTAWTYLGSPYVGKDLIRFDLSELSSSDSIIDARFNLYFDPNGSWPEHSGDNEAYIRRITQPWDFMTATWNNQPDVTEEGKIYLPPSVLPQEDYTDIDVTDYVKLWRADPDQNYGMMVSLVTQEPYACLVFGSSDTEMGSDRPKLVVTYMTCDPPVADFTYTIEEKTVTFEDLSTSATSWNWEFGDGYSSTLQDPLHTYQQYGIYEVCLSIEDSCGTDTICDTIKVCVDPDPHYWYKTENLIVSFFDSSTMPLSWLWDFGDGFFSDMQNPVHVFSDSGTYYVCETVTNYCGTETYCDSITLKSTGVLHYSGDLQFLVYPNPARDYLNIHIQSPGEKEILFRIINSQGIIVTEKRTFVVTNTTEVSLNLRGFSKGLYYLHARVNGEAVTRKFLVL